MFCIHLGSCYSSHKCIFYLNKFTDYDHGITLRKRKSNPNPGLNPTLNLPNSEVSLYSFAPIYLIYYMESYVWNLQYDWSVHFKERHKDQYTERTDSRRVKEENGSINCRLALISILQTDISPSQDIPRHFPFPPWNFSVSWNFCLRNVHGRWSLFNF